MIAASLQWNSVIESLVHLFTGLLNGAFRVDGVFNFFNCGIDVFARSFGRAFFPAGDAGQKWSEAE